MKMISVFIMMLFIVGCCNVERQPLSFIFKASDKVKVQGFYSFCSGIVTGAMRYEKNRYKVQLNCPGFSRDVEVWFDENELDLMRENN